MAEFWTSYGLPLALIVAQSVALLVVAADHRRLPALRRPQGLGGGADAARAQRGRPLGTVQSFADLLKFVLKEPIIPAGANKGIFLLAPLVTAGARASAWAVIPVGRGLGGRRHQCRHPLLFAISSLSVYGVIMAGWASNSKYAFLSALRSAAQMVSYEVSIGFVIITVLLLRRLAEPLAHRRGARADSGFWSLFGWYWLPLFPMFVIFFISALAETNRPPFDLLEAEIRTRRRLHGRILLDALPAVLAGRICRHRPDVRA